MKKTVLYQNEAGEVLYREPTPEELAEMEVADVEKTQSFIIEVKQEFLTKPEALPMFVKITTRGLAVTEVEGGFEIECQEIKPEEASLIEKYPELIAVEEVCR